MWLQVSAGRGRSRRATAVQLDRPSSGGTAARGQSSGETGLRYGRGAGQLPEIDVEPLVVQRTGPPERLADTAPPPRSAPPGGVLDVEEQLRRVELRLLAEVDGDPDAECAVRRILAESQARFATARVRQFVPILVEREVRRRLRAETA